MKEGLSMSRRRSLQASVKATTVEMSERAAISSRRSDGSVQWVDAGGASSVQVFSCGLSQAAIPSKPAGRRAAGFCSGCRLWFGADAVDLDDDV
jgi:hypothetical protein